jgi:hypothetical protein
MTGTPLSASSAPDHRSRFENRRNKTAALEIEGRA